MPQTVCSTTDGMDALHTHHFVAQARHDEVMVEPSTRTCLGEVETYMQHLHSGGDLKS